MSARLRCSVIIPTFNRAAVLLRCLDALAAQTVPQGSMEIIVADDGSTDATGAAIAQWAAHSPIDMRSFRQENAGANAARNAAVRVARAPLLLIINDDTIAVPGLLAAHLALHDLYPEEEVAVLGRMTIAADLPPSLFSALHHDAWFRLFEGRRELGWEAFFTCNLSVKRDFLLRFGLFDEALRWHEDIELGERLVPHGLRLLYCAEALGHHYHRLGEAEYLRIAQREGRALAQWHARRAVAGQPDNAILAGVIRPALRHRIADVVLNPWILPGVQATARILGRVWPAAARKIYVKIFQRLKRQAFLAARETGKQGLLF